MKVKIIAYGIARDILQTREMERTVPESETIAGLKKSLLESYRGFSNLRSLAFAVNASYVEDSYVLRENDEVVVIPPVSGG